MTPTALAQVVARLYTAAGRNYGKVELEVYSDALDDVTDDDGMAAARLMVRNVDLASNPPSPKTVRDTVMSIRKRRHDETPALPEVAGPYLPVEENIRRLQEARKCIKRVDDVVGKSA